MNESEFHSLLSDFIGNLLPSDKDFATTEFEVQVQPSLVSFSVSIDNEDIPLLDKPKFRLMSEKIETFHRSNTANGMNKWNKAKFRIEKLKVVHSEFIWDEEWEQQEIEAYKNDSELERSKWHWDNK
jgi:hypothetical protein